jgi:hypothetical protein
MQSCGIVRVQPPASRPDFDGNLKVCGGIAGPGISAVRFRRFTWQDMLELTMAVTRKELQDLGKSTSG